MYQQGTHDRRRPIYPRPMNNQREVREFLMSRRAKITPAIDAVQARRRANVVLDAGAVASFSPSLDVTNDVIAELNRTLTSIATTAPAQAAQPQGR